MLLFTILAVLVLGIMCFLMIIMRMHIKRFAYNVTQDYRYDCLPQHFVARLEGGVIKLPQEVDINDTVLAAVSVETSLLGKWLLPYIEIETRKGIWKHYIEFGGRGVRYLNFSDMFDAESREIFLRGRRVSLKNQEVRLTVYPRMSLDDKKILVLAPHADDAELAAYGLYEKYAANAMVVTVTASEAGRFHYENLFCKQCPTETKEQYLEKGRMRVWNSLTVPLLAGVSSENILQLGFFDTTLKTLYRHPEREIPSAKLETADVGIFRRANKSAISEGLHGGSNWHDLVDNMAYVIESFRPDVVVTPSPNIDVHTDHQCTTIAAVEALRKLNYTKGSLFLYAVHYLTDDYPLGNVGATLSLPPFFSEEGSSDMLYFHSIYSHPVDKKTQNRKLLALDAMNDIRPNARNYMDWKYVLRKGLSLLYHDLTSIRADLISRFVRSNEFFYVVPISDVHNQETYQKIISRGGKNHLH